MKLARILVVDDEAPVRELLRQVLEAAGHEVREGHDGRDVLGLLAGSPTDILILDVFMPDREGLETLTDVRKHHPHVKVIAISGGGSRGDLDVLKTARKLGAHLALPKPVLREDLLAAVDELLERD